MEQSFDTTNIPIDTLRSLLMVIHAGGVTAAATRLRLTQPAVTAQMKRLERLTGGSLIAPSGLTERGETVARYARKIISLNDQLLSIVSGHPNILRLGISPVMMYRLHDVFSACREIEEYIKLDIEPSKILEEKLTSAFVDVGLIISEHIKKDAVEAWKERFVFVVSKEFRPAPGRPVPFLAYPDSISHKRAMDVLEAQMISFKLILTSRDLATHFYFCESGKGVMVFPERFVPKTLTTAEWLPEIPDLNAGIYVRDGYEPAYLPKAIECLSAAFKP